MAKSRVNIKNKRGGSKKLQKGGSLGNTGFSFNQSDVIGGQMSRVGYSHCNNPDYFNQYKIYDVPVQSAQVGGKRKVRKSKKTKKSKTSKKTKKTSRK
jgi:hypothetical protein